MLKKVIVFLIVGAFVLPAPLFAATFNPNYVISDTELTNFQSMSRPRIQKFLESQTGTLDTYKTNVFGVPKSASDIIFDAAQYYKINPQFLLVVLQKEQSLVTDTSPSAGQYDWATGYGVCDSCSKNDPALAKFKGFYNQVNWAAKRNRQYINESGSWHFHVGGSYIVDDQTVIMSNQATVNLYTYTPHIHGNEVFHRLWTKWFATAYPDGTLLQAKGNPAVYLIQFGVKRAFWSKSAFAASYSPKNVIQVSQQELDKYADGKPIRFSEYSILGGPDGSRYLILNGQKRLIASDEVFRQIGYNPEEVITVTQADLNDYTNGADITLNSVYPTGALLQSKQTGGIVFVENGVRHAIWSKDILKSRFPKTKIIKVDESEISGYAAGDPVKFLDGELVTSPNAKSVYVISDGLKRPIGSADAFNQLGYKWKNIIHTTDKALEIHPTGDPINVN